MNHINCDYSTGVLPKYFSSEWSVAQFRLHEGLQYVVAFGHQKNTVVILGMDGRYFCTISVFCLVCHCSLLLEILGTHTGQMC